MVVVTKELIIKMKHKTKITSILAYSQILEELGIRQTQVFRVVRELKSCNNLMISKKLNLPINSITPRVNELRKFGIVRQHKKELCPYTGRLTIFWKPLNWGY